MSLRSAVNRVGLAYSSWLSRREFRAQTFSGVNERPVEYAFLFRQIAALQPRAVLDVGTGATALPSLLRSCGLLVTATDNVRDFWPAGMVNRHWHVLDDDITRPRLQGPFDLIACISVLEHIADHPTAVKSMLGLLRPGGHLVLTAPYSERSYCPNVYELEGSAAAGRAQPYRTQSFSRHELEIWLSGGAELVDQELWQFYDSEHWTVGNRLPRPRKTGPEERHQIGCMLIRRA
jgi:2-polyprenyl-3-methyl-5-hydroxy-6-metoxy-1,4-benzoquinol methylase